MRVQKENKVYVKSCLQTFHKVFLYMYIDNGYEKSVNFNCGIKWEDWEIYRLTYIVNTEKSL